MQKNVILLAAGAQHDAGMQGGADDRGLTAVLLLAACNIAIALLWSAAGHWTLSGPRWGGWMAACVGLPLLLPRYRADARIVTALATTLAVLVFSHSAGLLAYLLASTDAPLVDATLARWDEALGFDWVGHARWLHRHPWLEQALARAYPSILPQFAVVILYLAYARRHRQLSDFCGVLALTSLIGDVVCALWPAAGASKHFAAQLATDVSMLSDFEPLRAGTLRAIHLDAVQGLISIPSFHTILALLFMNAMRGTRVALPFVLLNALVLLSTPRFGGHYLVDMLGGAAVYGAAAWAWPALAARMPATVWPLSLSHAHQTDGRDEIAG